MYLPCSVASKLRLISHLILTSCLCTALAVAAEEWPLDRPTGGFDVDVSDRFLSRSFFNLVYRASEDTPIAWTGNVGTCNPGTTGVGFKRAVLARVNYFRAMAGVPASVRFDPDFSEMGQEAALIMSANHKLSHSPPKRWSCWSLAGFDGADNSNLSLGSMGWDAVQGQMTENGTNNSRVGHRRWILFPQTEEMGTGDIPETLGHIEANALWWNDSRHFEPRPITRDGFVAWPPPGNVPYQIVPPRWSLSYPGADFSAAMVQMTRGAVPVAVVLEPVEPPPGVNWFIGENTLVWVPSGLDADAFDAAWGRPASDTSYAVTVRNVVIDGVVHQFDYEVTVIDPAEAGPGEVVPAVSGPDTAPARGQTRYSFPAVPHAVGYEWRSFRLQDYSRIEGAEGALGALADGTDPSYPLVSTSMSAHGTASFHLAHTDETPPPPQVLTFRDKFLVGPGAMLRFESRLSWATPFQHGKAQLSIDGGKTWVDLHSRTGSGDKGETSFTQQQVPLDSYAGQVVMIRFAYVVMTDSSYEWFGVTQEGVGFYVDDIEIVGVKRALDETVTPVSSGLIFDFTPGVPGNHGIQVRPLLWEGYPALQWGPAKELTALETAPAIAIAAAVADVYVGLEFDVTIEYANEGVTTLTGVQLALSSDSALELVSSSIPPDAGAVGEWTRPSLAPGEIGSLSASYRVSPGVVDGTVLDIHGSLNADQGNASGSVSVSVDNSLSPDTDGDRVLDVFDNCPLDVNAGQEDLDADGEGDVCDPDDDNDGLTDDQEAALGTIPTKADSDGDGSPDQVDPYPTNGAISIPQGVLDVTGNGLVEAQSDGLLVMRYLFGFAGESLIVGALEPESVRTDPDVIAGYLAGNESWLDVDDNGDADALTDGILIRRYLSGFRGDDLIRGAVANDANRRFATEVDAYIRMLMP